MSVWLRPGGLSRLFILLFGLLSACAARGPTPPPPRPPVAPVLAPTAPTIPGSPVVLSAKERALAHFLTSRVAQTRSDYDTALSSLARAVELDPDTALLRFRLAKLYVRMGKTEQALQHCRIVVEQEPENLEAQMFLAGLLSSTRQEDEAAGSLRGRPRAAP